MEQMFAWRAEGKLGLNSIAARLNASPAAYPSPGGRGWTATTVYGILANPKYTGYMVYGRRRRLPGHRRPQPVPADQWLWSPEPVHPAIITRATWEAAQTAGAEHGSSRDEPGLAAHPAASHAGAAAHRERETAALHQRLRKIDAAENAHARETEHLSALPPGSLAVTALRSRIIARFAELDDERAEANAQLAALARQPIPDDPSLLDALPMVPDALPGLPARLKACLYQAFDLQRLYNKDMHQVTIHVTITPITPAAIISQSDPPPPAQTWPFPYESLDRHGGHIHA